MNYKELDEFLNSMTEAACAMDMRAFGENGHWASFDPLIAKSWTTRVLKMIDDCQKKNLTPRNLLTLVPNMTEVRDKLLFDLWMSKYAGVAQAAREKIFDFYNEILKVGTVDDPYASSKNVIHTKSQIQEIIKTVEPAEPQIAKRLGRLVNACYNLGYAMYSDMNPSLVYENYGPYEASEIYGPNHIVAIKEFGNLRCPELWPESAALPHNKITISCVYKDVGMTMDACSHATYTGDLINSLKYYKIETNGHRISIDDATNLTPQIENLAASIYQQIRAMDLETQKEKYWFQKAYFYKWIYEKLGQDWRPSPAIIEDGRGKPLYILNWPENHEEQKKVFRSILDPRTEFVL